MTKYDFTGYPMNWSKYSKRQRKIYNSFFVISHLKSDNEE